MDIRRLGPHEPLPDGGRNVVVLHRFDEDDPRRTATEITLTGTPGRNEVVHPVRPDGSAMELDEAIAAARQVAESEGLTQVFVVDRTAGPREQQVLQHDGDHSVDMGKLDDMDLEEGERGPDMRDRRPW